MHHRVRRQTLFLLPVFALSLGCFPKAGVLPGPLAPETVLRAQSRSTGATAESLERGRGTFVTYCDNCHHYPALREYSETQWPNIARRMGKKARISPEDSERLLQFVLAARSEAMSENVAP